MSSVRDRLAVAQAVKGEVSGRTERAVRVKVRSKVKAKRESTSASVAQSLGLRKVSEALVEIVTAGLRSSASGCRSLGRREPVNMTKPKIRREGGARLPIKLGMHGGSRA